MILFISSVVRTEYSVFKRFLYSLEKNILLNFLSPLLLQWDLNNNNFLTFSYSQEICTYIKLHMIFLLVVWDILYLKSLVFGVCLLLVRLVYCDAL